MDYLEFKKEYPYAVKHFRDCTSLFEKDSLRIGYIEAEYVKDGRKWVLQESRRKEIDWKLYMNYIDGIGFHKAFFNDLGASEHVDKRYTRYGLLPIRITSIGPGQETKTIREFRFE